MDKRYSGVSEYTLALVKEILAEDKSNEYLLYYNSYRDISERLPKFDQPNVKIYRTKYPNKIFNYILQKIFCWPKIDKLLGGVDVFWAPHINFLSLSSDCRKIITIHDLSFLRYPEYFSWRKNIWHRALNVKKLIKQFDLVIAISENTRRDVVELCGVPEEKARVIYSGVDERFKIFNFQFSIPKFQNIRKKYNLPEKYILFLGTVEPRKNIVGLIQAYNKYRSQLSNVNLACRQAGCQKLIIAGGMGWKYESILAEREKSKYKNDIIFLGYVDDEDKPALYKLASVFVFPSFYEGFGFPPLEAMASGTPVIASAVSSLPEVVGEAAILVNPFNINEIAKAIEEVLNNQKLRESLIAKGLKRVEKFSWERVGKEYSKILNFKL